MLKSLSNEEKDRKLTAEEIHELAIAPLPSFRILPKKSYAGTWNKHSASSSAMKQIDSSALYLKLSN